MDNTILPAEEARQKFINSGFNYSKIGSKEIAILKSNIESELKKYNEAGFTMKLLMIRQKDQSFFVNTGGVEYFHFRVSGKVGVFKGKLWTDREAISFNRSGYIGFAGWASSANTKPFIDAFSNWIDDLLKLKGGEL
jgi:hypothetical protein